MSQVQQFIATQSATALSSNERLDQVFDQLLGADGSVKLDHDTIQRLITATINGAISPGWTIDDAANAFLIRGLQVLQIICRIRPSALNTSAQAILEKVTPLLEKDFEAAKEVSSTIGAVLTALAEYPGSWSLLNTTRNSLVDDNCTTPRLSVLWGLYSILHAGSYATDADLHQWAGLAEKLWKLLQLRSVDDYAQCQLVFIMACTRALKLGMAKPRWMRMCMEWCHESLAKINDNRVVLPLLELASHVEEGTSDPVVINTDLPGDVRAAVDALNRALNGETLPKDELAEPTLVFAKGPFRSLSIPEKCEFIARVGKQVGPPAKPNPQPTNKPLLTMFDAILTNIKDLENVTVKYEFLQSIKAYLHAYEPMRLESTIGVWVIGRLNCASRLLRITASRLLPFLVQPNTKKLLKILDELSENKTLIETNIMAWAQVGRSTHGETLNVVLLRLLEGLVPNHTIINSLTMREIFLLAEYRKVSVLQLLTPFWPIISIDVVNKLTEDSGYLKRVAEMLGIPDLDFLQRTQEFTVPYLVLGKHYDIVACIADTDDPSTLQSFYLSHIHRILAVLLVKVIENWHNTKDDPLSLVQLLIYDSGLFQDVEFATMAGPYMHRAAFEILRRYNNTNYELIVSALECLSGLKYHKGVSGLLSDNNVPQQVMFASNVILNDQKPYTQKIECLNALSMLMRVAPKETTGKVVHQICAILQCCLDDEQTRPAALGVWLVVVSNLEESTLQSIINLTFALITQRWEELNPECRDLAKLVLDHVVLKRSSVVQNVLQESGTPSLGYISELAPLNSDLIKWTPPKTSLHRMNELLVRCQDENVHVVRQTVMELRDLLKQEAGLVTAALGHERTSKHVKHLMRTLLGVSLQFSPPETDVADLCAECLGLIGALNHHRVNITPEEHNFVLLDNFNSAHEAQQLVAILLENYLVRTYRALTNPHAQLFLAYGIQELCKFCGLRENAQESEHWARFSLATQSTLIPLLSSKYSAPRLNSQANCTYPIFAPEASLQTHSQWLIKFSTDLMSKAKGHNAETVFQVFLRATSRSGAATNRILNFLLPYAALNVVLSNETNRNDVLTEILTVLQSSRVDTAPFHQTIFVLVDYLAKWVRKSRFEKTKSQKRSFQPVLQDPNVVIVETLLGKVSSQLLAVRSFECGSYPRAIMYWEDHLRRHEEELSAEEKTSIYTKFQEIYSGIDDPDSLDGIAAKFPDFGPSQQVLRYESTGRWEFALECYEAKLSSWATPDMDTNDTKTKIFNCLKQSGRYSDLLSRLETEKQKQPEWTQLGIEVSWLASDWEALGRWLENGDTVQDSYEANIGNALLAVKRNDQAKLQHHISQARRGLSAKLSTMNVTSLSQCHDSLTKLHALADLQDVEGSKSRLEVVGADYPARRHLLALRRAVAADPQLIADAWLQSAVDARLQGQMPVALQSSIRAGSKVENARVLWEQGEQRKAPAMLETVLSAEILNVLSNYRLVAEFPTVSREQAEIAMLYTTWLDESNQEASEALLLRYKALTKLQPQWEKCHYMLAKYYNKLFDSQNELPEESRNVSFLDGTYVTHMVSNYLRSLQYGVQYIYETLPKLVTVWLDFAVNINKVGSSVHRQQEVALSRRQQLKAINKQIRVYYNKVPGYIFYLVLPQLLSRMLHENEEVVSVIKGLIIQITSQYPHQALWYVLGSVNSTDESRCCAAKSIIDKLRVTKTGTGNLRQLIEDALTMTSSLIALSKRKVEKGVSSTTLEQLQFRKSAMPSQLVVPVQAMISTTLPSHPNAIKNHTAFPSRATIHRIDESVSIQNSLQKPKRIVMVGSDGKRYRILCKSNDDVRKDARLMEFARSIDKLLKTDSDAAQRHLRINTYHVTPMTELCGLIEWVDGADAMRSHITNLSRAKNVTVNWNEAKQIYDQSVNQEEKRIEGFRRLKAKYPPVLHEWFIETFADPSSWLEARTNFVRTCAVMSMVGFIVGLGDRHSENLLLVQKTGAVMHVDFDMLFDKGLTLGEPERVPFRLTQQLVAAMGVSGYEGLFRKSCEVSLKLLRENESMLMTVLEPFLHEPFVEWMDKKTMTRNSYAVIINGVKPSRSPQEAFSTIRNKIRGIKGTDSIPLSVSGQVEYLIKLATNERNLSQMYIGWGAFM